VLGEQRHELLLAADGDARDELPHEPLPFALRGTTACRCSTIHACDHARCGEIMQSTARPRRSTCHPAAQAAIIRRLMAPYGDRMAMPTAPPGSDGA
jgi:hypothetical protein